MAKRPTTNAFASLFSVTAGGKKGKKAKTEEEKEKERARKEGESDEDYNARMAALDAEDDEDPEAEDEEDETEAESDKDKPEGSTNDKDDEKCAAARLAGYRAGAKAASKAERARWTDTLTGKHAKGRGAQACMMLSSTDMSAVQISKTLAVSPRVDAPAAVATPPKGGLAQRMEEQANLPKPTPSTAEAPAPGSTAALAAAVVAAAKKFDPKGRS